MFDEQEPLQKIECPSGNPVDRQSPDAFETEVAAQLAAFKPIGGEIVVTPSALKLGRWNLLMTLSDCPLGCKLHQLSNFLLCEVRPINTILYKNIWFVL